MLCDFGSATPRAKKYETASEIGEEEENIRRHTTPAYRAPEVGASQPCERDALCIGTRVVVPVETFCHACQRCKVLRLILSYVL